MVSLFNFFLNLDRFASKPSAVASSGKVKSYKELLSFADTIVKPIKSRCLVFLLCTNTWESLASYVGIMRAGAIPALLSPKLSKEALDFLIQKYQPKYILLPSKSHIPKNLEVDKEADSYLVLKNIEACSYEIYDELAQLVTTSGSTGSPKFVRQSYENIYSNAKSICDYLRIGHLDRPITTLPMSYSYGLSIVNSHLLKGSCLVLNEDSVITKKFWQKVNEARATTFGGVPYTYEILHRLNLETISMPSIKYLTQAGGKLDERIIKKTVVACKNKGLKFYIMYGQTEACARMSYVPWERVEQNLHGIGLPIPGGKFQIMNEDQQEINKSGEIGELVYEGDNVMLGYAENLEDLKKGDENKGILFTGDLALKDSKGMYFIKGRKSRFLKIFGNRISLNEVEEIMKLAGYDCVCSGSDDRLRLYLTRNEQIQQAKMYISKKLDLHHSAVESFYLEKLPRNEFGKISYAHLKS